MIKEKLKTYALQNTLLRKQEVKLQSEKKHLQTSIRPNTYIQYAWQFILRKQHNEMGKGLRKFHIK